MTESLTQSTSAREPRPWVGPKDRWIPFAFAAFCLVVLAANGTMIAIAVATWPGLETRDAFRNGLGYNAALAAARERAALGWRGELAFESTGAGRGRLELRLSDAEGRPVERAQVRADLVRPARTGHDFSVRLARDAAVYTQEAAFPLPGVWDVRLLAENGADQFRLERRIVVP